MKLLLICFFFSNNIFNLVIGQVTWNTADRTAYPWIATIQANFRFRTNRCYATLVDPSWLLTTAHCVKSEDREVASSVVVVLGKYDLNQEREATQIQRTTSEIVIHPDYSGHFAWDTNIALIKLPSPVQIRYARLPYSESMCSLNYTRTQKPPIDKCEQAIAIGWTKAKAANEPNLLRATNVTLLQYSVCEDTGRVPANSFTQTKICAPANSVNGSECVGDSGAALTCKMVDQNYYIIALASYGQNECSLPDGEPAPKFHTRICQHLTWIVNTIKGLPTNVPEVTCNTLPWIYNGFLVAGGNTVGTSRRIICFRNHHLIGNREITCLRTGRWSIPGKCIVDYPSY